MELGVFIPIANNGWMISKTAPQYKPTFELNRPICQLVEEIGFDFVFCSDLKILLASESHWEPIVMTRVGFIGLGQIGRAMALNLVGAFDLMVHDLRAEPCEHTTR
jgi:hypothetical protein